MQTTLANLRKRGFDAHLFATASEASEYLLQSLTPGATIGIGGSITIQEMELDTLLKQANHTVYWHWSVEADQAKSIKEQAMEADVYLCSANALTQDGMILNTDGNGNRVAATIYGPGDVYFIVGKNKICPDLASAYHRIKNIAAPMNAKRLHTKTPCATTGKCEQCLSPQVLCGVTALFERPTSGHTMHVLLVDENLGY